MARSLVVLHLKGIVGGKQVSQAPIIMVIRHAEKADSESGGVLQSGEDNRNSLSVRGWQRAGALVPLFAPGRRQPLDPRLAEPAALISEYADAPGSEEKHSKREEQTLGPLAEKLGSNPTSALARGRKTKPLQPQGKPPVRCLLRGSTRTVPSLFIRLRSEVSHRS